MRLPVHCCCTPDLKLGTVEVPDGSDVGPVHFVIPPRMSSAPVPADLVGFDGSMEPAKHLYTEIARLGTYGSALAASLSVNATNIRLAVKSAHQPLEVWLQVPSFRRDVL